MVETEAPKYVPFDQVAEWTDRVSVGQLQLPAWFERDQFGLNLRRLETIANWYGLGTVALSSYRGETTAYSPEVSGMDRHGTAVAGQRVTVKRPETFKHTANGDRGASEYRHPDITVSINNPAIDESLLEKREDLRDAKARAVLLNKAARKGLRSCANKQILNSFAAVNSLAGYSGVATWELLVRQQESAGTIAADIMVAAAMFNVVDAIRYRRKYGADFTERNWSLFIGVPFDRLVVANGLVKATKLIKALR